MRDLARGAPYRLAAGLTAAALLASPPVLSRTITVDDDGPAEFQSIQAAILAAVPGDVVSVAAGTYNENLSLRSGVSVIGAGLSVTTVNGGMGGPVARLVDCDASTILKGFTLTNGQAPSGGGVYVEGGAPIITLNRITGNTAVGSLIYFGYGGGLYSLNSDATISDNTLSSNSTDSGGGISIVRGNPIVTSNVLTGNVATYYGGSIYAFTPSGSSLRISGNIITSNRAERGVGISVSGLGGPIVSNNLITGNTGVSAGLATYGGGVELYLTNATLANNTLASNRADVGGGASVITGRGETPVVVNNVVYNNRANVEGGGFFLEVSAAQVLNNIFHLNAPETCGADPLLLCSSNANLTADPLLVNPTGGDYRLRTGSPAIDTGTATGAPADDLRGQRRPLDGNANGTVGYDRGAYEFDRNDVLRLRFSSLTLLTWDALTGATAYHVYSGGLASIAGGLGECRDPEDANRSDLLFSETRTPATGSGLAYLVTGVVGGVEGSPGWNSLGLERVQTPRCP